MAYVAVEVGHINSSVFEIIAIVAYNAIIVVHRLLCLPDFQIKMEH